MNAVAKTSITKRTPKKPHITVAEYLSQQIDLCGKSQIDIARECNFPKPNIISMLKKGDTNLPVAKVGLMAKALGVDPVHLFKLVMQQYSPETWEVLEHGILNQPVITQNEMEIIDIIRQSNVENPKVRTDDDRLAILKAVSKLKPDNATRD